MLRTTLRILKWIGLVVLVGALVLTIHVWRTWDRTWDASLPDLHASTDPNIIKRGEYLVAGPAHCIACHVGSVDAYVRYTETGELPALTGGYEFAAPPLGAIYSKNLTPDPETGIGRYSDPQLARMLRYSVRPDGRASIQPLMQYADMSDDDVVAVLSFLRAQPAVRNAVPPNRWTTIGKVIKSLAPTFKPRAEADVHAPATAPQSGPTVAQGEYLVRGVGDCSGCHSPLNQLTFALDGPEFSGGAPLEPTPLPGVDSTLWFKPPNITPLKGSALLRFPDRATFVARFLRGGRKFPASPMPWESYAKLTEDDAGAIYEFLYTLPAAGEPVPEEPTVKQGS